MQDKDRSTRSSTSAHRSLLKCREGCDSSWSCIRKKNPFLLLTELAFWRAPRKPHQSICWCCCAAVSGFPSCPGPGTSALQSGGCDSGSAPWNHQGHASLLNPSPFSPSHLCSTQWGQQSQQLLCQCFPGDSRRAPETFNPRAVQGRQLGAIA